MEKTNKPEIVRTWRVETSPMGVRLTLNGKVFELGASKDAFLFDFVRASRSMTKGTKVRFSDPEIDTVCGTVTQEVDARYIRVKWEDRESDVIMRRDSVIPA